MTNHDIPVSVIIPNFNSGNYLTDCIKSINSGRRPVEVVIVDDCSTDDSFELALKLQTLFPNVRVVQRDQNGGIAAARKTGIANATQDLIAFVDADDMLEVDALEVAYSTITSEQADICIWELWRFDKEKQWRHEANPTGFPKSGKDAVLLTLGRWGIHPLGITRKQIYEMAYRGFNEDSTNADELITRLAFKNATKVVGCKKQYLYRVNPLSTSRALSARRLTSLRSHLWLLCFAQQFHEAPIRKMALDAIWEAWFYWSHRRQIGKTETLAELRMFMPKISRLPKLRLWLWTSPKIFFKFVVLSTLVGKDICRTTKNPT